MTHDPEWSDELKMPAVAGVVATVAAASAATTAHYAAYFVSMASS